MLSEKEFIREFEREMEVYRETSSYINPLAVFESYYFKKGRRYEDYRDEAMDRCISERVNFSSTENNQRNIMKNFIKIGCPECSEDMTYKGSNDYICSCGNKVQLYVDDFMVEFSKKPWFKVEALNRCEGETKGQLVVLIKAWFKESDLDGEIVAEITKYDRIMGGKWFVRVDYFNNRARTDEKVDEIVSKVYEELRNE